VVNQVSFNRDALLFKLSVNMHQEPIRCSSVVVRETDTVAVLISRCGRCLQHYFASNSLRVLRNDVDLATLNPQSTLAHLDINETTKLIVEETSNGTCTGGLLNFLVKTMTGKSMPITTAYSHW
jgi:hypothetical protein